MCRPSSGRSTGQAGRPRCRPTRKGRPAGAGGGGDDAGGSFKTTLVLHLKEKEHMPRLPQKSEALIDLDPFMVTGTAAGAVNGHSPVQEAGLAPWTIDSFAQQQDVHTLARRDSLYNRRQEKHHGTLSPVSVVKTDSSAGKQKGLPGPGVVAADVKKKQQQPSPKAAADGGCCNGAERVCRSEYVFSEEGDPSRSQDSRLDLLGDGWPPAGEAPPARGRAGRRLGSGSEPLAVVGEKLTAGEPQPTTAAPDRPVCASPDVGCLFSDSPEPPPAHDLGVGSLVEVVVNKEPRYGVIRWIGTVPEDRKCRKVAGIEMEEEYVGLTDGTFSGRRYFHCNPKRAMFVGLRQCQKDSRFQDAPPAAPDCSPNTFGQIDCPPIKGPVRPISRKGNLEAICGKNRGIQGHHNSCYLDATLFSMFTFTSVFDGLLFRPRGRDDSAHYDEVQRVLREEIVNPLRANLYVRADRVMKLRTLLENLSSVSGLTSEEKDPEEFLNSLVAQTLRAEPLLKLSSGQEAYHYQLFVEKDERVKFPSVQQLLEQSFLVSGIKLKEVPSCLIIQMPRFGKSFKMYQRILPSQLLDVTDIIEDSPRQCVVCGKPADYECKECYGQCGAGLESTAFCVVCLQTVHGHQRRASHSWRPLKVPAEFRILQDHCAVPRLFMELFAVVCIETSHYVAFVKCGGGHDAPWCFFDSMADRKGERNGYNIPEVVPCPGLPLWLSEEGGRSLEGVGDDRQLPEHARRLLCDAYMCMYQSPDVAMYR
ncbi:ubiquitin carboxyl-terminal hydrolase CYLD [Bacillus rossius redtenbacheri]|uniref:ubiquitin carboxyl-terminal hydrolase CYLD n=1 Tax=Bacillus rossius redtenbacheri TaxID=93214 RepID=UPI002FDE1CA5